MSSAAVMSVGHCEELFTQIFLRLAPKSLLQFQCVSKQWRSIISNPDFRRLHGRNFHTCCLLSGSDDALIIFRRPNSNFNFLSFRGENVKLTNTVTARLRSFHSRRILWLHSCNGLLCIDFVLDDNTREIMMYNPATSQSRIIPKCKFDDTQHASRFASNISFDPVISDHYKIVCFYYNLKDVVCNFVVYSSETMIWKDNEVSEETADYCFENGIQWNCNLHWVNLEGSILCFDLNKESLNWSVPSLPMLGGQRSECRYFGESGDCLIAIMVNSSQPMLCHVFNMKRDYSAWLLKLSIDLNHLSINYPSMLTPKYHPRFDFPRFIWCKNVKRGYLVISMDGKIILYDISEKSVRVLSCSWINICGWKNSFTFSTTLAPI